MRRMRVGGVGALLLACLVRMPLAQAQQPPAPAPEAPTFRSGVDRVTVDATIVTSEGEPIGGLTVDDFVLEIDGRPRAIQSLDVPTADPGGAADGAAVTGERFPEISTNGVRTPTRHILIVVDQESLTPEQTAQTNPAVADLVRGLAPTDRVGLLALPGGVRRDFSRDHDGVIEALRGIIGSDSTTLEEPHVSVTEGIAIDRQMPPDVAREVIDRECPQPQQEEDVPGWQSCQRRVAEKAREVVRRATLRAEVMLSSLQALIGAFGRVSGSKTLVLVSSGFPAGDIAPPQLGTIGREAARASISVFAVQPFRPTSMMGLKVGASRGLDDDRRMMSDGLANLASASGGVFLRPSGQVRGAFERISRELTATYQLAFDALPEEKDGKPHRIALRLARGTGRLVRHRQEFVWRPASGPAAPPDLGEARRTAAGEHLAWLLATGETRAELPMRVSTFTAPTADAPGQTTTLWTQIDTQALSIVQFQIVDTKNQQVVARTHLIQPSGSAPVLDHFAAIPLPPGRYIARVASQDDSGRVGVVEHPFEASLGGAPELKVGSLLVLDERTIGDGRATPIHVSRGLPAVRAHLELQSTSVDWSTVRVTLDVVDPRDGRVQSSQPLTVGAASTPDRRVAHARVALADWVAGTYLFKVAVASGDRSIATTTRSLVVEPTASAPRPEATSDVTEAGARLDAAGLEALVALGTAFVATHVEPITSVVAEEHYVQIVRPGPADPARRNVDEALEWRNSNETRPRGAKDARLRRQTIADVLTIKTAEGIWTSFRDVAVVDGREVKGRSERALSLFTKGTKDFAATLRRVANESSRRNLGRTGNLNTPLLPLQVLHPAHRARFAFESAGTAVVDGILTQVVVFREVKGPMFVSSLARGQAMPTSGRLWVQPSDGRIRRAELLVRSTFDTREPGMTTLMVVEYRSVPELDGLLMPVQMWERHTQDSPHAMYVERRATYTNYRRFTVTTTEQ